MSAAAERVPGREAIERKGWFGAHRFLILRRLSQVMVLGSFALGPLAGVWFVKGNLNSSRILDTVPLTDPFIALQSLAAGYLTGTSALAGALLVTVFYAAVGGRVYCSWVCPVNAVTDLAAWLRRRFDLRGGVPFARVTRYWLMAAVLVVSALTGMVAWELINPVSMVHRGLLFGMGLGGAVVGAVFLFDLFVSRHGWCGRLCPVGAFYSVLALPSLLRVSAVQRAQCDDCMECFAVCPEPHVIRPALKGAAQGIGPVILSPNCTNCGRCIDICPRDVFVFTTRFQNHVHTHEPGLLRSQLLRRHFPPRSRPLCRGRDRVGVA